MGSDGNSLSQHTREHKKNRKGTSVRDQSPKVSTSTTLLYIVLGILMIMIGILVQAQQELRNLNEKVTVLKKSQLTNEQVTLSIESLLDSKLNGDLVLSYLETKIKPHLEMMEKTMDKAVPKNVSKPLIHAHALIEPVEETEQVTPNSVLTEVLMNQFLGGNSTIVELFSNKTTYPFWDQIEQESYNAIMEQLDASKEETFKDGPTLLKTSAYFDKHDQSMHTWLQAMESGTLDPNQKYTIVHIDSHPDMSPVWNMSRARFRKGQYHDSNDAINIASFILPFAYLGHVHKVVWVKAPWCSQFNVGKHYIEVGLIENKDFPPTVSIGVNSTSEYFNTLGNQKNMLNPKVIEFEVVELKNFYDNLSKDKDTRQNVFMDLVGVQEDGNAYPVLVDLDLDYFATTNPMMNTLLTTFKTREMVSFFKAFIDGNNYCARNNAEFPVHAMVNRVHWTLKSIVKYMVIFNELAIEDKEQENLMSLAEDFFGYWCKGKDNAMQMLEALYFVVEQIEGAGANAMKMFYADVLPTVLSTDKQIREMSVQLSEFLLDINKATFYDVDKANPAFITVARSAVDDYTPVLYLEKLEKMSYDLFNAVYRNNSVYTPPTGGYETEFEFTYNDDWEARVSNEADFYDAIDNIKLTRIENFNTSNINASYVDLFTSDEDDLEASAYD